MTKLTLTLALIFASTFLFSCEDAINSDPNKVINFNIENAMPASVGNYWVYQRDVYEVNAPTNLVNTVTDSIVIAGVGSNNGKTYYDVEYFIGDSFVVSKRMFLSSDEISIISGGFGLLPFLADDIDCECHQLKNIVILTSESEHQDSLLSLKRIRNMKL